MQYFGLIALIALCAGASGAAVKPLDPPDMGVLVEPGNYTAHGRSVTVKSSQVVQIAPMHVVSVKAEKHVLSTGSVGVFGGGTALAKTLGPVDTQTRLPKAILPESVRVYSAAGVVYSEGADYNLEHIWGGLARIDGGRIGADEVVLIDYDVCLQRIDEIVVSPKGIASVQTGKSAAVCPEPPSDLPKPNAIARVYVGYRKTAITAESIYPLPEKAMSWADLMKVSGSENLSHTRSLLSSGKPVSVVCWGDSVTEGASPSSHDKCYVELFRRSLKAAYPKASISLVNAGIGGSNTDSRREGFEKEVLAHNPDLITVEFVNDSGKSPEHIASNYREFMARAREANPKVEFIIITPHLILPEWMGGFYAAVDAMRKAAADNGAALADTTRIWDGLRSIGVPYETLLANAINHPNDLGHEFFAASLMELLREQ